MSKKKKKGLKDYREALAKDMKDKRWCFCIPECQDTTTFGGYVPSLIVEGTFGHRPLVGRDDGAPWVWGKTLEEAQAACTRQNEHIGVTEEQYREIMSSTFKRQHA